MNITCSHCGCVQPISLVEVKTDYKLLAEAKKLKKEIKENYPYKREAFVEPKLSWFELLRNPFKRANLYDRHNFIENSVSRAHETRLIEIQTEITKLEKNSKYWICKLCKSKNGVGLDI